MKSKTLQLSSDDMKFKVAIEHRVQLDVKNKCQQSNDHETGGIITGYYNSTHDNAVVTSFSAPPKDSAHGRFSFSRGVEGIQLLINKIWPGYYYLGEWHYHPYSAPTPSGTDINQMKLISESNQYKCPEPLLIIVGGNPFKVLQYGIYVFPRGNTEIRLSKIL